MAAISCSGVFAALAIPLSAVLAGMVIWLVVHEDGPSCCGWGTFGMHAVFMTLAFGMFAPLSALAFVVPRFGLSRDLFKKVHMLGHGSAVVFACMGVVAEWKKHSEPGGHHLASQHSWVGICAVAAYVLNWVGGLTFAMPRAFAPRPEFKKAFLPAHVFLGSVALAAGLMSIVTGLLSHLRRKAHQGELRWMVANWASIVAVCLGVAVFGGLYRPFKPQEEDKGDVQKESTDSTTSDAADLESSDSQES